MTERADDFVFNDEFFTSREEWAAAADRYDQVWFALDPGVIVDAFSKRNEAALETKAMFQVAGRRAILLGVLALVVTSAEIVLLAPAVATGTVPGTVTLVTSVAATAITLAALVLAFRLGVGPKRRSWLAQRAVCERIRQWRWQYLIATADAVLEAAPDPARRKAYVADRDAAFTAWLQDAEAVCGGDVECLRRDAEGLSDFEMVEDLRGRAYGGPLMNAGGTAGRARRQLIEAYGEARLGGQLRYTTYQLNREPPKKGAKATPAREETVLRRWGVWLLTAAIVFEVLTVAATVTAAMRGPFADAGVVGAAGLIAIGGQFTVLVLTFVALGFRTLGDGLRSTEHVARLSGYKDELSSIYADYARDPGPAPATSMIATERAAYNEMIEFLRAGLRSSFIL